MLANVIQIFRTSTTGEHIRPQHILSIIAEIILIIGLLVFGYFVIIVIIDELASTDGQQPLLLMGLVIASAFGGGGILGSIIALHCSRPAKHRAHRR